MDAPLLVEREVEVVRAREDQLAAMRLTEHCPDEQTRATRPEQLDRRIGVGHASPDVEGLGCAPDHGTSPRSGARSIKLGAGGTAGAKSSTGKTMCATLTPRVARARASST